MVEEAEKEAVAGLALRLRTLGVSDHRLLSAVEAVPRQSYVPVLFLDMAYGAGPMPIECGQTMPAPELVVRIIEALEPQESNTVLELGTGSGYQTALLSKLCRQVTTLERFASLYEKAKLRFENQALTNIHAKRADGRNGVAGRHFDRIIANCAFTETPKHLTEQLSSNGIMIAPVGPADGEQILTKFTKIGSRFDTKPLFAVRFSTFSAGLTLAI